MSDSVCDTYLPHCLRVTATVYLQVTAEEVSVTVSESLTPGWVHQGVQLNIVFSM